jgi:uncharacterized membrane protein HdeD (DUF308 family)
MTFPFWLSITVVILAVANLVYILVRPREPSVNRWAITTGVLGLLAGIVAAGLDGRFLSRTTAMQALSSFLIFAFFASLVLTGRVQRKQRRSNGSRMN